MRSNQFEAMISSIPEGQELEFELGERGGIHGLGVGQFWAHGAVQEKGHSHLRELETFGW